MGSLHTKKMHLFFLAKHHQTIQVSIPKHELLVLNVKILQNKEYIAKN